MDLTDFEVPTNLFKQSLHAPSDGCLVHITFDEAESPLIDLDCSLDVLVEALRVLEDLCKLAKAFWILRSDVRDDSVGD